MFLKCIYFIPLVGFVQFYNLGRYLPSVAELPNGSALVDSESLMMVFTGGGSMLANVHF